MNSPLLAVLIVIVILIGSTLTIMNKALQERLSRVVHPDVHRSTASH